MTAGITGKEYQIGKIFSDDFLFEIPRYQRPYSWTTEHAEELLSDLFTFMGDEDQNVSEEEPYFLGSIVLIKQEDKPESEVIDGQQRLTTLAILLSVLRPLVSSEVASAILSFLIQEGNIVKGTRDQPRLILRSRDQEFFSKYIQSKNGFEKLKALVGQPLSDAQTNIRDNAIALSKGLSKTPVDKRERLIMYIIQRCYLIAVSTPNLDAAYRIFSILNDRGIDLTTTDILKARIIGKIARQEKQDLYTKYWEDQEEELGRNRFQEVFTHIRMIYLKSKPRENLLRGFVRLVKPEDNPEHFIDHVLTPYVTAYDEIVHTAYDSSPKAAKLNKLFTWLNRIDNKDWLPPAMLFYARHTGDNHNYDMLFRFFTDLERLAAGMMIYRANINQRMERYGRLIEEIEDGGDLFENESALQLKDNEKEKTRNRLNGDLYYIRNVPRYVLLRLDSGLSDGSATYKHNIISIEHVLPQHPKADSDWRRLFPDDEVRRELTHKLGNLVLLSRRKNSKAQNFDFDKKKRKYFMSSDGVATFALTTQVLTESSWTPKVINHRQRELMEYLIKLWRL